MKFTSHGRKYEIDSFGVIHQTDAKPYVYDAAYSATYDTPEYTKQSELLQALRLGFVIGAHGRTVFSLQDCGYGNGAFMKFANKVIPDVIGKDVTGVKVEGCYITDKFVTADVITFWDCLEHIPDLSFLSGLTHTTCVISLPYCHMEVLGQEWFDTLYKHRKPDEHLHHFNESSLRTLMASHGWISVAKSTHEDIVRKSAHNHPNILTMAFKRW